MNDRHPNSSGPDDGPTPTGDPLGGAARDADDERVSAVLDGEAGRDDAATVAADPDLAARLERFREIRDEHRRLASDDAPTGHTLDRRIAVAVAELGVGSTDHPGERGITRLHRDPRSHRRRLAPVAIAAAIVLVVLGAGIAVRNAGEPSEQLADSATVGADRSSFGSTTTGPDPGRAEAGATESDKSSAEAPPASTPANGAPLTSDQSDSTVAAPATAGLPDLGAHRDVAALLASTPRSVIDSLPLRDPAGLPCPAGVSEPLRTATATIAGSFAVVTFADGTARAVAVPDCRTLP